MLRRLAHRGFVGMWVDLFGYGPGTSPEVELNLALGTPHLRSADGRYLFYDLRPYAARYRSAESIWSEAQKRAWYPVELIFQRGFYEEDRDGAHSWHWARKQGQLVLVNPLETWRQVRVSMQLRTGFDKPRTIRISILDHTESVSVGRVLPWERVVALPPLGLLELSFSCDCKRVNAPSDPRNLYFNIDDLKVEDR